MCWTPFERRGSTRSSSSSGTPPMRSRTASTGCASGESATLIRATWRARFRSASPRSARSIRRSEVSSSPSVISHGRDRKSFGPSLAPPGRRTDRSSCPTTRTAVGPTRCSSGRAPSSSSMRRPATAASGRCCRRIRISSLRSPSAARTPTSTRRPTSSSSPGASGSGPTGNRSSGSARSPTGPTSTPRLAACSGPIPIAGTIRSSPS